ncbi:hypothetical protein BDN72DRAFT_850464 [Pluteus cervinus]|uniref:Uncharacterized protein n=1 Tax=Pluteus cervinus TaxID=181527 RepID=A0ACD3A4J1_9AGAR|nr:hypothetical protein BDN72DRAFT_850464 [Pluteus cervinus]
MSHNTTASDPYLVSPDARRAEIDDQIRFFTEKIVALKVERNGLEPVHRMPTDILLRVFSHLQSCFDTVDYYQWTLVLQVCHYWREIASETSSLWHKILQIQPGSFDSEWARISLIRSRNSPLDIEVHGSTVRVDMDGILVALSNFSRIRTLQVNISKDAQIPQVSPSQVLDLISSFGTSAPLLEHIQMNRFLARFPTQEVASLHLFNGIAPRLRIISITDSLVFQFHNLSLPSLVELTLESLLEEPSRIPLDSIISLLRTTRVLSSLKLTNAFVVDGSSPSQIPVFLPRLSSLTISGTAEQCVALLSRITVPRTTIMEVDFSDASLNQPGTLFDAVAKCFQSDPGPFHLLEFSCSPQTEGVVTLSFWEADDDTASTSPSSVQLTGQLEGVDWFLLCQRAFPISELRSLSLCGEPSIPLDYGQFSSYPLLSHLKVAGPFIQSFLNLLDQSPTVLPYLRILRLEYPEWAIYDPVHEFWDDPSVFKKICAVLKKRKDGPNGMLEKLVVTQIDERWLKDKKIDAAQELHGIVGEYVLLNERVDIYEYRGFSLFNR